jgi:predicted GNAT family N-acyltransferase
MSIEVVKLPSERFSEATELIWQVFQVFEVPDFPKEGVIEYKRILDKTEKEKDITFYTAMENDIVVGALGMRENNHIGYFYVKESHHKRGIGKMLFMKILQEYKGSITVNACPYGVPIYERLGFIKTDTQQNNNGIIFTPMRYEREAE